jgi:hypothetical protein
LKLVVEIVKFIKKNFSSSTDAGFKEEIQLEGQIDPAMNFRIHLEKTDKVFSLVILVK